MLEKFLKKQKTELIKKLFTKQEVLEVFEDSLSVGVHYVGKGRDNKTRMAIIDVMSLDQLRLLAAVRHGHSYGEGFVPIDLPEGLSLEKGGCIIVQLNCEV